MQGKSAIRVQAKRTEEEGRLAFGIGQLRCPHNRGTPEFAFWRKGSRAAQARATKDIELSEAFTVGAISRDTKPKSNVDDGFHACAHTVDGAHAWAAGAPMQCTACRGLAVDLLIK